MKEEEEEGVLLTGKPEGSVYIREKLVCMSDCEVTETFQLQSVRVLQINLEIFCSLKWKQTNVPLQSLKMTIRSFIPSVMEP